MEPSRRLRERVSPRDDHPPLVAAPDPFFPVAGVANGPFVYGIDPIWVVRAGAADTRFPQPDVDMVQHTTRLRRVRQDRAQPSRVPEICH